MFQSVFRSAGAALALAAMPINGAVAQMPSTAVCDQACLTGVMNYFLDRLAARDPSLPFAVDARHTQNEQVVEPGDGLWATVSGLGGYRHIFSDPITGEVAAFVTIEEQGEPALLSVRLKVAGQQIAASEMLLARSGGFLNTDLGPVKEVFTRLVPQNKRMTREQLIALTDPYFDAIEQGDGDIARFHARCNRVENGVQTTNNPSLAVPGSEGQPRQPMGCRDQIENGVFNYITKVSPRRYHIVDPARGLVFGMFLFRHDGTVTEVVDNQGNRRPMVPSAKRFFDVQVAELFKIEDGQILEIEAVMTEIPYRTPSAWPGGETK